MPHAESFCSLNERRTSALQQRPKACVPRNSRGAASSSGTARKVSAPWVASGSKAAWGRGPRLRADCPLFAFVCGSHRGGAPGTKTQWLAASRRRIRTHRAAAQLSGRCGPRTSHRAHSLAKVRGSLNKAGECGKGRALTTRLSLRISSERARAWRHPLPVARLGVPTKPAQFPFLCGRDLRKAKPRELPPAPRHPPAVRAGTGGGPPRGRLRLFFWG